MCRVCIPAPAFPAPQIPTERWEKPPPPLMQGKEMVLGMKDSPRAGMERCWMQPEDIRCFQAYNSWCWLMEKQDLSREGRAFGQGTARGQTEPLGVKPLCLEELCCSVHHHLICAPTSRFPCLWELAECPCPSIDPFPAANVGSFAGLCLVYL